jgi:hypothetical protein
MRSIGLLWVSDELDSFEDAVWFWNTRALRPGSAMAGISLLATLEATADVEVRAAFVAGIAESSTTTPTFVIASRSVDESILRELGESLGATRHESTEWSDRIAAVQVDAPLTFAENVHLGEFWSNGRTAGAVRVLEQTIRRPTINLNFESPKAWHPKYQMSGRVNIQIASPTITGPQKPSVAQLYLHAASWRDGQLLFETHNQAEYNFTLQIPTAAHILAASCRPAGIDYELSDKGQQIQGALRGEGDLELFRRRSTLSVIEALTPTPSRRLAKELKELSEALNERQIDLLQVSQLASQRASKTMDDLRSIVAGLGHATDPIAGTVEELVARGLILMGVQVNCPICSLKDFQALSEVSGAAICAGCRSRAAYEADNVGSPAIHYRLNSLAHRLSLNGGLAPLAATALLISERAFVLPGVNLMNEEGSAGEADLLGWVGRSLFVGEAKSSAIGFDLSNIAADVRKSASVGADTHVAVCPERLSPDARGQLERACKSQGVQLRLLCGDELLVDG